MPPRPTASSRKGKPLPETITLPSGGTVTFRSFDDLRGRDRYAVETAVHEAARHSNESDNITALIHAAKALITAWTLPYLPGVPIPSQVQDPAAEPLGDLLPADWAAVTRFVRPAIPILFPPPVTPDDANVPGSPTPPDAA